MLVSKDSRVIRNFALKRTELLCEGFHSDLIEKKKKKKGIFFFVCRFDMLVDNKNKKT